MNSAVRRRALALLFALTALSAPARADDFYVPLRFVRTRVTVAGADQSPVEGRLLEIRRDTLTVVRGEEALDVPFREIERFEVGRGLRRATAPGALVGTVVGGGLGAVLGAASDDSEWQGVSILIGAGLGVLNGAAGGALVGSAIVHEEWDEVALDRTRVGPAGDAWIPAPSSLPIRVTAPLWRKGRWVGTVRGRTGDTFLVSRLGRDAGIPARQITRLEAAWSKGSRWSWGALIGLVGGFTAGVLVHENNHDGTAMGWGSVLGLVGAGAGTLLGGQLRYSRWEEIPLDPPALEPVPGGATPAPSR